jgi:hypothetical protein
MMKGNPKRMKTFKMKRICKFINFNIRMNYKLRMPVTKKNQGLKIMKIRMLRNFVTVLSE